MVGVADIGASSELAVSLVVVGTDGSFVLCCGMVVALVDKWTARIVLELVAFAASDSLLLSSHSIGRQDQIDWVGDPELHWHVRLGEGLEGYRASLLSPLELLLIQHS